ncbi:hypothetical protein [Microbispora sp. H10830]|uniref:hypothetical protein n=1 Tax=Microbispora sp. H10830 TaxID=2729109 RepID=UPI0015FF0D90|nr:hypothetical protein [Microbispora sp. H10830]
MPALTPDEIGAFAESVDGELRRAWPSATVAGPAAVRTQFGEDFGEATLPVPPSPAHA